MSILNITPLDARGRDGGGTDVIQYLRNTAYYQLSVEHGVNSATHWMGKGATELGLQGDVNFDVLEVIIDGYAPDGVTKLRQNAGEKAYWEPKLDKYGEKQYSKKGVEKGKWKGQRVGIDFTVSADKDVSLAFKRGDAETRQKILDAWNAANAVVVDALERDIAESRRGKTGVDGEFVAASKLVVASFTHLSSRNLDADLHQHMLMTCVAQCEDGQWRAVDYFNIFMADNIKYLGAMHRAEFAAQLVARGFPIEVRREIDLDGRETGDVFVGLRGVEHDDRMENSTRRVEILDHMAKTGSSAQSASLATRADKDEPEFKEMDAYWKAQDELALRENPRAFKPVAQLMLSEPILETQRDRDLAKDPSFDPVLSRLHTHNNVATAAEVATRIALENMGRLDASGVREKFKQFRERDEVAHVKPLLTFEAGENEKSVSRSFSQVRYSTHEVVSMERELVAMARSRIGESERFIVPKHIVDAKIKEHEKEAGHTLSSEQRGNIHAITTRPDGLIVSEGRAGAGKSSTAKPAIEAFETQGFKVIGMSPANVAAKNLEAEIEKKGSKHLSGKVMAAQLEKDIGRPCYSVAAFLANVENGKIKVDDKSVLLVDEAGMMGTRDMHAVMSIAKTTGAKVWLTGDTQQLQAVSGGGAMRQIANEVGKVQQKGMRRQRDPEDIKTAELHYSSLSTKPHERSMQETRQFGSTLVGRYQDRGQVETFETRQEAMEQMVEDFIDDKRLGRDKIILAGKNTEVTAINNRVRAALKERGELSQDDLVAHVRTNTGMEAVPLTNGDRIKFDVKNGKLGVYRRTQAIITSVTENPSGGLDIQAEIESASAKENGRKIEFNSNEFDRFRHCYALTVHAAQGLGVNAVYQFISPTMVNQHSQLVAFTRMKEFFKAYGSELDMEMFEARIGRDGLKQNAIEEGIVREAPMSLRSRAPTISRAQIPVTQSVQQPVHKPKREQSIER